MSGFNVLGLDANFSIIQIIRFTNLQWNRQYHEAGTFSLEIPLEQYSEDIKYIYTKDRPEMGVITQWNYMVHNEYSAMQLSGYFLENDLDKMVVYPKGTSNITGGPTWTVASSKAETVAYAYFNAFKSITFDGNTYALPIIPGTDQGRGKDSEHHRNGEKLGYKIYDILKPSGMSFKVTYDFVNNQKHFEVWQGGDKTQDNTDGNNPIIFSTKYGNVKNPNVVIDETTFRNAVVTSYSITTDNVTSYDVQAAQIIEPGDDARFMFMQTMLNPNDYGSTALFEAAMKQEGINSLENYGRIINLEFDTIEGSYEYMDDFDIGDLCSIEIPEMGVSADARLIGCYEVMKNGEWFMTMEFGTPILR